MVLTVLYGWELTVLPAEGEEGHDVGRLSPRARQQIHSRLREAFISEKCFKTRFNL